MVSCHKNTFDTEAPESSSTANHRNSSLSAKRIRASIRRLGHYKFSCVCHSIFFCPCYLFNVHISALSKWTLVRHFDSTLTIHLIICCWFSNRRQFFFCAGPTKKLKPNHTMDSTPHKHTHILWYHSDIAMLKRGKKEHSHTYCWLRSIGRVLDDIVINNFFGMVDNTKLTRCLCRD